MLKFSSKAQTLCGHVLLPGRQAKGLVTLVLRHALVRPFVCLPMLTLPTSSPLERGGTCKWKIGDVTLAIGMGAWRSMHASTHICQARQLTHVYTYISTYIH